MSALLVSVIIPTHNRPDTLALTIDCLRRQCMAPEHYEIIIVDDGSQPPATVPESTSTVRCTLIRLPGVERSAARNAGANAARGNLLVFVDDDVLVPRQFLLEHVQAHRLWPGALLVGAIQLPSDALKSPFVRFRQRLEGTGVPLDAGPTTLRNFCAAGNMAIAREQFHALNGFDPALTSSEDQDLALRHTGTGGHIAFVPTASVVHHDRALDIRSYCRRVEWGSEHMIPFCLRYPEWPDNRERDRINGPIRFPHEALGVSLRKVIKAIVTVRPMTAALFVVCSLLERVGLVCRPLDWLYRLLLGAHIFRGYRRGVRRFGSPANQN